MKTSVRSKSSTSRGAPKSLKPATSPTRSSSRIAKAMALKAEENHHGGARQQQSSQSSKPRGKKTTQPQIKEEPNFIYESFRDNPHTSNINRGSFVFSDPAYLDSCKCQMLYEELNIDFYPSAIRAIENSENDSAIDALHNVESTTTHIKC